VDIKQDVAPPGFAQGAASAVRIAASLSACARAAAGSVTICPAFIANGSGVDGKRTRSRTARRRGRSPRISTNATP